MKKRNKVSAEFSMSSLTDIIFLLLIFFMLTSKLTKIPSDNLPESDSKTVAASDIIIKVDSNTGKYLYNETSMNAAALETVLRRKVNAMGNSSEATITIVAEKDGKFKDVVALMEIAAKLKLKAIIATQPKPIG